MQTLTRLASNWEWILIGIVLLIIILLVVIFLALRRANKRASQDLSPIHNAAAMPAKAPPARSSINPYISLRISFLRALGLLKNRVTGHEYRYRLPWFLMLGESDSGKTTVLNNTGLNRSFGSGDEQPAEKHESLQWFFFDNAVVMDVGGDIGGRTGDLAEKDGGWNALLRLLLKYRPQHAIDGVVLTIPAEQLIGPASLKADRMAAIKANAANFYQRLWRAQKMLGLSFPVYVLVTKCDQVPGFRSFCGALPKQLQDDIFGWSNPYTLENSFSSSWLYEAFEDIGQQLVQLQLEIFAEQETVEDKDDLFFFPARMQELQPTLQAYLEILFRQSGYHQPFFLRGIYFCGDGADSAMQLIQSGHDLSVALPGHASAEPIAPFPFYDTPAEAAPVVNIKPVFVKHLFERKIFEECALARPVFTTLLSRNRATLAAQIALLVIIVFGGLGLTFSYRNLSARSDSLKSLLDKIPNQIRVAREAHQGLTQRVAATKPNGDAAATERQSLAYGQPDLNTSRENLREFIGDIVKTDGSSFYSVFMPSSWFSQIDNKMETALTPAFSTVLLDSSRMALDERVDDLVNNENIRLNYFLVRLNELVRYTRLYGRLTKIDSGSVKDLEEVVRALQLEPLGLGEGKTDVLYHEALFRAVGKPLNHSAMNEGAGRFESLLTRLYEDNVKESSKEISTDFLEEVIRTDDLLSNKDFNWLANYHFVAHPDFGNKTYQVAVHDLRVAFSDLARERFMQRNALDANFRARLLSRGQLTWDKISLQKAIGLYDSYENYIGSQKNTTDPVQRKANDVALNQLQSNLVVLIKQAQQYGRNPNLIVGGALQKEALSDEIQSEVNNLKDVEEPLSRLMDICDQIGIGKEITAPVSDQTSYLLEASYRLMLLEKPYTVKRGDFSWWDGSKPVSLAAFSAKNHEELARYLASTREGIAQLANEYATPIITFVTAKHLDRLDRIDYRKRWLDIIEDLDAYKNKVPENSVSTLENFISVEMDKTNAEDCLKGVPQIDPGELSDGFFRRSRLILRGQFYQQCELIAESTVLKQYNEAADYFNRHLAGRFPFADLDGEHRPDEADPQLVLEFFQLFDRLSPQIRQSLRDGNRFGITRGRAVAFIDQMEKARAFLIPFIGKASVPICDMDVKFRANERQELWASQIIEWQLDVGKDSINFREPTHVIRWRFGDPIRLSLRWAKDSPTIPDPDSRAPFVQGRTATFEYTNYWSLLTLLIEHATVPTDFYDPMEADPATLKFAIPVKPAIPAAQAVQPTGRDRARVFIRVITTPTDKKEPLAVPVFPRRAPSLVQTLLERAGNKD